METNSTQQLLGLIEEETGVVGITPDMTFEQIGMDSLDYVLLIQEIRQKIGPLTTKQAQSCAKVSDLLEFLPK